MRRRVIRAFLGLVLLAGSVLPQTARAAISHPFGSHGFAYAPGTVLPNHVSQAALDAAVADFYDQWKARYLSEQCGPGRYVVLTAVDANNLTVSEGHGYGMMLAVLMAGHDPDAQTIFDGMYTYFREHPTATHDSLMSWYQNKSCQDAQGNDSASDGDLDIAFALLMADEQWGSAGAINYRNEALAVLADIKDGELDQSARYVLLGDWVTPASQQYYPSTRTSDFLTDHYRSFGAATGDPDWIGLLDETYAIVASIQSSFSPLTGLLPDFVRDPLTAPAPVGPNFLEGPNDGAYSYNATRDPWRLGTDFVVSGDARAAAALQPINAWIRAATGDDPAAIRAGYALDGTPLPGSNYPSLAFIAPFGVAAMTDVAHQGWLNAIWDFIVATPIDAEGYYENSIKLFSMIVMSGNWWAPQGVVCGDGEVGPGEQCDDGNTTNGDGCDNNCTFTGCGNRIVTAGEQCDDGNTAAGDCCDPSCQFEPNGAACDDGAICTTRDVCDGAGACAGSPEPQASCTAPLVEGKSVLSLKERGDTDTLVWKWTRGPATSPEDFGDPTSSDDYTLCVYEEDAGAPSHIVVAPRAPSGSGWFAKSDAEFRYRGSGLAGDPVRKLKLRAGDPGKAKLTLKAKGSGLGLPSLGFPADARLTAQLRNTSGACFGAVFVAPFRRNDSSRFRDTSALE